MKIKMYLLIALVMVLITGCVSEVIEQDVQDEEEGFLEETVETTTLSERENYMRFAVDLTCKVFGGDDIQFMDEYESDVFAQQYGFANMEEAELVGEQFQDMEASEEYLDLMSERCPEYIDWLMGMGEGMSETLTFEEYVPAEIDLTAPAYDRYIQMNVHMTCDPDIINLEGEEADEMARKYGFSDMNEAYTVAAQNPNVMNDLIDGLETACPDVHAAFIGMWS